jgi:type I restriction enzyme S subunit
MNVISSRITPCMENGKGAFVTALPTRHAFGSTEFHVLRPRHCIDGKFLYPPKLNRCFPLWSAK